MANAPHASNATSANDDHDDEFDADTSPGLIVSALASPIHEGWGARTDSLPPTMSSIPPDVRVPSLQPISRPSALPVVRPVAQPANKQGVSSGSSSLQLVLARTSLPDAPPAMLAPVQPAQGRPEEPRRAATSIVVFAAMLCAAGVPLARYALGSERDAAHVMPRVAASAPLQRTRAVPAALPEAKRATLAVPLLPTAPSVPARIDRLAEIMTSLPTEAEPAAQYLLDHAVRAKDSGELQLAETLLGRASELDEHNPHPAYALAKLRFEQGNYEGAEGWIANAIRLRPRRAEYRTLYAEVLERLGREREARDERRRAKRLSE